MKIFTAHITDTNEELCIAARTPHHATEVLSAFWLARTGAVPGRFYIKDGPPSTYQDAVALEIIAERGIAAVILPQTDGSLHVDPALGR
jgi:hypothetical protein